MVWVATQTWVIMGAGMGCKNSTLLLKNQAKSAFLWNPNSIYVYSIYHITIKYFLNIKHKQHRACRTLR